MPVKRCPGLHLWGFVILLLGAVFIGACSDAETTSTTPEGVRTWLLVKAPDGPLPANRPITVKSRTEAKAGVSHVELYAVELPGEQNILIRSDPAPFEQTIFTASQVFTPIQSGHYVIKVVGYDKSGESAESEYISFEVQ